MLAVVLMLALYGVGAGVVYWVVARTFRRSEPELPGSMPELPSTVPQAWVDEYRDSQ